MEALRNQFDESLPKSDSDSDNEDDSDNESEWESRRFDDGRDEMTDDEELHPIDGYPTKATDSAQDSAMTEFLELLFHLSIILSKQEFLEGDPGSTLSTSVAFSDLLPTTSSSC